MLKIISIYSLCDHIFAGGLNAEIGRAFEWVVSFAIYLNVHHAAEERIVRARCFGSARSEACENSKWQIIYSVFKFLLYLIPTWWYAT